MLRFAVLHFQEIALFQFCAGNYGEWLEVGFSSSRLQSEGAVMLLDQIRCALDAPGPRAAAFHCGRGEGFHVIQVPFGVCGIGISRNVFSKKSETYSQADYA